MNALLLFWWQLEQFFLWPWLVQRQQHSVELEQQHRLPRRFASKPDIIHLRVYNQCRGDKGVWPLDNISLSKNNAAQAGVPTIVRRL